MKKKYTLSLRICIPLFFSLLCSGLAFSQNTFKARILNEDNKEPLVGALVRLKSQAISKSSDLNGRVEFDHVPNGSQTFLVTSLGYRKDSITVVFPLTDTQKIFIIKVEPDFEMTEVVVSSTRTGSRIENVPLKVEVIGAEDVEEKYTMKPANISMLLTENTGVQAQLSSATSGNINIRIQGLDGRYTQILKDGMPLYGGFSGGLGLLQTAPLDLKQVEIIKGSASTLFGGDAIAGAVNLISKEPTEKDQFNIIINETSLKGTDIASFYSKRKDKMGFTLLVSASIQNAVDDNDDGISDLPLVHQYTINPRFFYYFNDSTKLIAGLSSGYDNRVGGRLTNILDNSYSFSSFNQQSTSSRNFTQLKFEEKFAHGNLLTIKNTINFFNRTIIGDSDYFAGSQLSTYTEASYLIKTKKNDLVFGVNFLTDKFDETKSDAYPTSPYNRNYQYYTVGAFIQDDLKISDEFIAEAGLRTDYHSAFGPFVLPRLSLMYKFSADFLARLGGGYGYRIPSVFSDYSENTGYRYIESINPATNKAETSKGANMDFNYRAAIGEDHDVFVTINQSFFYTNINNPVIPVYVNRNTISYENAGNAITTKGFGTNISTSMGKLNFVVGYSYTDAQRLYDQVSKIMPLAAKNLINLDMLYDDKKKWKFGLEGYFIGQQMTSDYSTKPAYWLVGALVSRTIQNFTFSLNFENLLDIRQTKYESILYIPNPQNTLTYRDIWAPLDGRVANISMKINF